MTTTTHKATCTCCGTGELKITVDDAGSWSPTLCPNCNRHPLSMTPESHAELMRRHEAEKERGGVAHHEFPRIEA